LQFGTLTDPSFRAHYRLRHREVGGAKDLSAPLVKPADSLLWGFGRWTLQYKFWR